MKVKFFSLLAAMLITVPAFAFVFTPPTRIVTLPNRVSVEIINNTFRPIACSGQINGFKVFGQQVLPFNNVIVPAGASYPVTLLAVGTPFVNSTYNVGCAFIGW